MAESKIQWTENTWNPWHGCVKVSPGCKFCYMYRDKERYGQDPTTVLRSKSKFNEPLKWEEGKLIFTCSWSDWFIEEADEWRDEAWKIIRDTPQHTYQILTKRPERIADHLPEDWGEGYPNVWIGVSVENQKALEDRFHHLIKVNAAVRFLSIEPLIGPVALSDFVVVPDDVLTNPIHWAIIGGESGNDSGLYRYRPCEQEWIASLVSDLRSAQIPTFVKQLGTHLAKEVGCKDRHGGDMEEWPDWMQVREMPKTFSKIK